MHTTLSDGGGTPEDVIAAARAAGLSFLIITDHNNLDAKPYEGYHDKLLVLVGTEVSTTAGHLLGLGIPDPVFRFPTEPREALDDVRILSGFAVAAHPDSPRHDFRWTGWDLPGGWGIEVLNGDSQWRDAGWTRLSRTAALYPLNHDYALLTSLTPVTTTLSRWDALLKERNVPGLAGVDAHSRLPIRGARSVRFPSYEALFRLVRNHVLLDSPPTGKADQDARAVVEALARGRSYVGVDALAPASGFCFTAEAEGRAWTMGDTVAPVPSLRLRAGGRVPRGAVLTLLKDGAPVVQGRDRIDWGPAAPPGVYRVEARLPGWPVPWVLSNPIFVAGPAAAAQRMKRASAMSEAPVPAPAERLDSFDGSTRFAPESDASSFVDTPVLDAKAGTDARGAARLAFRLGTPGPEHPYTWCALVNRERRDLSGRMGLVFAIRSDGVYRVRVEVRDENPASSDDATEWWFTSIRAEPNWRRVAIPFSRLRSVNPRTDRRLDLDRVRAIVFVLDVGTVKAGTRGTIWIDELGVY